MTHNRVVSEMLILRLFVLRKHSASLDVAFNSALTV